MHEIEEQYNKLCYVDRVNEVLYISDKLQNSIHLYLLFDSSTTRSGFFGKDMLAILGRRRFAPCDCWTQTSVAGNAARQLVMMAVSHVVSYFMKRSVS